MNKTKIKTMLMFALAILGGSVWASYTPMPRYTITSTDPVVIESPVVMPRDAITSFTVTIMYESGNQRSNISQVELVDPVTENRIAIDVHDGYSGTSRENHVYTLSDISSEYAGKVLFVKSTVCCNEPGTSTCRIDLSNGVEHYVLPYSFGVNFKITDGENISTTTGAGFSKGGYSAPVNWINWTASGGNHGAISVGDVAMDGTWTAYGAHNSGCDISTDVGKLLYGYLDDCVNDTRIKATVTITGLPTYRKYAVALILSGDGSGGDDYNNRFSPVLLNNEVYAYNGTTLVKGEEAKTISYWGDRSAAAATQLAEGTNVMFVEGLSGSVLTISSAVDAFHTSRLTIAAIQVWVTDEESEMYSVPDDKEIISINFAQGKGSVSGTAGLVRVGGWNNVSDASGTNLSLSVWDGAKARTCEMNFTYGSANIYQWTDASDAFLKGYLDDGVHDDVAGPTITASEIPFEKYSVIVYAATDTAGMKYKGVTINGQTYIGTPEPTAIGYAAPVYNNTRARYGASRAYTACYGVNAIRVDGLSGDLTIQGGSNDNGARGGIAAIQIVNTGDRYFPKKVTVDGVEYDYVFRGISSDNASSWDVVDNWVGGQREVDGAEEWVVLEGTAPCKPDSARWGYALLDGEMMENVSADESGYKTVTATLLEGWNSRFTVRNGVKLVVETLQKLQCGDGVVTEWRIDDTSKIVVKNKGTGTNGGTPKFYVNSEEGLVFETTALPVSADYYFDGDGSVLLASASNQQSVKSVVLDLGDGSKSGREIVSRKLIGFENSTATFSFEESGVVTSLQGVNAVSAAILENPGEYLFELKSDGYYVKYVAYSDSDDIVNVPVWNATNGAEWGDPGNWSNSDGVPAGGNVKVNISADATLIIPESGVRVGILNVAAVNGGNASLTINGGVMAAEKIVSDVDVIINLDFATLADGNKALGVMAFEGDGSLTFKISNCTDDVEVAAEWLEFIRSSGYRFVFAGDSDYSVSLNWTLEVNNAIHSHLVFESGKYAMRYGYSSSNGNNNFGQGATVDNPTLWIKSGVTVDLTAKDLSYWSGAANADGIIRVSDGGRLNLLKTDDNNTCYYRQQFYLEPGSILDSSGLGENKFRLQGGSTNAVSAVVYVPASDAGDEKPARIISATGIYLADDATRGVNIEVGEGSKLFIQGNISAAGADANYAVYKHGAGNLEIDGAVAPALIVNGGAFTMKGSVANLELRGNAKLSASDGTSVETLTLADGCAVVGSHDNAKVVTVANFISRVPNFEMALNGSATIKLIKVPLDSEFVVTPENITGGLPKGWGLDSKQDGESILWMLKRTGFFIRVR